MSRFLKLFVMGFVSALAVQSEIAIASTKKCGQEDLRQLASYALEPQLIQILRDVPPALERIDREVLAEELSSAGIVLRVGEKISRLRASEDYVYLVINLNGKPGQDFVVYSPYLPEAIQSEILRTHSTPEKFLATHRSLLRKASQTLGISVAELGRSVRAAGEFSERAGGLRRVYNRAGTYPNGGEALDYGYAALRRSGVVPGPGPVELMNYATLPRYDNGDPNDRLHGERMLFVRQHILVLTDPELREAKTMLNLIYTRLATSFPRKAVELPTDSIMDQLDFLPDLTLADFNAVSWLANYLQFIDNEGAYHSAVRAQADAHARGKSLLAELRGYAAVAERLAHSKETMHP